MRLSMTLFLACALGGFAHAGAVLIHNYQFQGNVNDLVGSANGALMNGAMAIGGVLNLSGSQHVQFASHIVPTSGSYSVFLFAQETVPTATYVEFISQGFSGGPGFYIGHNNPASGQIIRASDLWQNTSVLFPTNVLWNSYALVVDSAANQSLLYVNGALAATLGSAITTTAGGNDTRLGRQFDPFNEFLTGKIADAGVQRGAYGCPGWSACQRS